MTATTAAIGGSQPRKVAQMLAARARLIGGCQSSIAGPLFVPLGQFAFKPFDFRALLRRGRTFLLMLSE